MSNFQVIFLYVWEPTDKISDLHGTLNKNLATMSGSAKN